MTIATHIKQEILKGAEQRLARLLELAAPQVIIDKQTAVVTDLKAGGIGCPIGGDQSLLELEFTGHEVKKGRGGKPYVRFETPQGYVHYYPQARHGRYIAVADK